MLYKQNGYYYILFITKLYSIKTLNPKIGICNSPKIRTTLIYIYATLFLSFSGVEFGVKQSLIISVLIV